MSQVSDVVLANQGFASFRTELNNILGALNTQHVGSSAPGSVAAGTIWVDNGTSGKLKVKINYYDRNMSLRKIPSQKISHSRIFKELKYTPKIKIKNYLTKKVYGKY